MDGVLENFKFNRNTSTVDYGYIASLYDLAIRLIEATVEHYFCSKLYLFKSNYFSFRNENFFSKKSFYRNKTPIFKHFPRWRKSQTGNHWMSKRTMCALPRKKCPIRSKLKRPFRKSSRPYHHTITMYPKNHKHQGIIVLRGFFSRLT